MEQERSHRPRRKPPQAWGVGPLLAAWLGDGKVEQRDVLRGGYRFVVAAKEPWRLGKNIGARETLVASGKEAFVKLKEAAGIRRTAGSAEGA